MEQSTSCESCVICSESFAEVGEHKAVSIKCGHIFGDSCIRRWFTQFNKRTCPICKDRWRLNQIRPVYGYKLHVVDNKEIEQVKKELEEERIIRQQVEGEKRCAEAQLESAMVEAKRLRSCLLEAETQITHLRKSMSPVKESNQELVTRSCHSPSGLSYHLIPSQESKCIALTKTLKIVQVDQRSLKLKQVFAVTCREEWAADFHEAGRGVVWDIQVSPDDSQVCIAVGKQLCLRSLRDMQTIVNFQTEDAAVLSCVWDETGHKVFAGLGNGTVKQYDLRRPDPEECVSVLKCADHSGIHSLVSSSGKIYGSTRQAVIQWDENDQGEEISHVEGSIESLAYDAGTSCLVSSVRPLFENGQAKHDVWSLKENSCKKVTSLCGHKSYQKKTRGCFVPVENSVTRFASGDEFDGSICLWDVNSNVIAQRIPCSQGPIMQLQCQQAYGRTVICALTQRTLAVYIPLPVGYGTFPCI